MTSREAVVEVRVELVLAEGRDGGDRRQPRGGGRRGNRELPRRQLRAQDGDRDGGNVRDGDAEGGGESRRGSGVVAQRGGDEGRRDAVVERRAVSA